MEEDLTVAVPARRSSYIPGCMMSPPCFPVPCSEVQYSRIHYCNSPCRKRRWRWRNILRRLIRESKTMCTSRPKPLSFQYDPVSYSQNFDEGTHLDQEPTRISQVFPRC